MACPGSKEAKELAENSKKEATKILLKKELAENEMKK